MVISVVQIIPPLMSQAWSLRLNTKQGNTDVKPPKCKKSISISVTQVKSDEKGLVDVVGSDNRTWAVAIYIVMMMTPILLKIIDK